MQVARWLTGGTPSGRAQTGALMVTEKIAAFAEATATMAAGGSAHKAVKEYRKHVRANARCLRGWRRKLHQERTLVLWRALHYQTVLPSRGHLGWPRGGVVTQRTANPCTPVRFRARPPAPGQELKLWEPRGQSKTVIKVPSWISTLYPTSGVSIYQLVEIVVRDGSRWTHAIRPIQG